MGIPKKGGWQAGRSGNPNGRPKGIGEVGKLRKSIAGHIPEIIAQMVNKAKEGDVQAAKLLLERVVPTLKSAEQSVVIDLPADATLSEQGSFIIQSIANGILAPIQGSALLTSLGTLARIKEIDELEKRLTVLEQVNEQKK